MPTPTLQATGAAAGGNSTAPASSCPVTTTTGRLILWTMAQQNVSAVITAPTGFTKRFDVALGSYRLVMATKTGVVGDSGTTLTGSSTVSASWGCRTFVYTDYDTAFAGTWVTSSGNGTMSTTSLVAPTLTTNVANAAIVGMFVTFTTSTITPDALMTEISDASPSFTWEVADEARPTIGATGSRTAVASASTSTWTAGLLQIPGTTVTATLTQSTFRGRNDDGTEATATWKATAGTDWTQAVDTNFRVRFNIADSVAAATQNTAFILRYSLNGGAYTAVSASSSVVRASASPNVADGAATTEQLAGAGTFNAGTFDEVDGSATGFTAATATGQDTEVEYSVQIRGVDVADADTINLRVYDNAGVALNGGYTDTPIITVSKPSTARYPRRVVSRAALVRSNRY